MKNSRIKLIVILGLLTAWVIYSPSTFQKGGVQQIYYILIPLIIIVCSLIWILPNRNLKLVEKLILPFATSFIALFISTIYTTDWFVEWKYSDNTWFLWENKARVLTNTVYYGTCFLLVIGLTEFYKKIKRLITKTAH